MSLVRQGANKVQEECGELLQALAKREAAGPGRRHWDGSLVDLRVEEEMADVLAAIQYAAERMGLNQKLIAARMEKKYALYCKWERDELEGGK